MADGLHFSEPLAHVTINYDHEKVRPMLLVTFPKGCEARAALRSSCPNARQVW